jgi:hypothetical protein
VLKSGCKEIFRAIKAADGTAIRFQKVTDRFLDGAIIIDNCNHVGIFVTQHSGKGTAVGARKQSHFRSAQYDFR